MIRGVVEFVNAKPFGNKTLYSIKVAGEYYGTGNRKPECEKGDTVEFNSKTNARGYKDVDGDIKVVGRSTPNTAQSSGGGATTDRQLFEERKQAAISLQSARNTAIEATRLLIEANAIKLPAQANKIADVLLGWVDDLTERYYAETTAIYEGKSREEVRAETSAAAEDDFNDNFPE